MIAMPLTQDAPAILTGIAATLCLSAAPMFRSRRMILLVQLGAALCFSAHYLCLGLTVAAVANMLGMVQIGAALFAEKSRAMSRLGYALIGLMALLGFAFWQGPVSGLAVAAMVLIALARMQANELRLRGLLLAGGCFWMMHDFMGAAWIALAADIGAFAMGAVTLFLVLFRVTIEWRVPSAGVPAAGVPAVRA
ncbi:MAG: YgjV family protein [Kiloniellaceae bacterium]